MHATLPYLQNTRRNKLNIVTDRNIYSTARLLAYLESIFLFSLPQKY